MAGDNRYGTFKYGTSKYGASTAFTDALLWGLLIDWDGDKLFDGDSNEATYLRAFSIERTMRDAPFTTNSMGQAQLARNKVGKITLTLDNSGRRYDPWYASSPLYPNVVPGRNVRLLVRAGATTYNLFTGTLDAPENSGYGHDPVTHIAGVDGWQFLSDADANEAVIAGAGMTIDPHIALLLTDSEYPFGSVLDIGADVLPYQWSGLQSVYAAIHDLVESEGGIIFIAADGKLTFVSRTTLASESPAFTLLQSEILNEPVMSQPWDYIRNKIKVLINARTLGALTQLYARSDKPAIAAGATLTSQARYTHSGKDVPAIEDVLSIEIRENQDGTGAVRASSGSYIPFAFGAEYQAKNEDVADGYLTTATIDGFPLDLLGVSTQIKEDTTSQAMYGIRPLVIDNPFIWTVTRAEVIAALYAGWKDPLPLLTIQIVNRPAIQFAHDLGTRLTFTSAFLNINRDFRIIKIKHQSRSTMQDIWTTWTLEPIP